MIFPKSCNPTAGMIDETEKSPKLYHSKRQSNKQSTKTTSGLHTRQKSYTFKDIVKAVALLAISTKHCRRYVTASIRLNIAISIS